jgi:hypothetical protein
VLVVQCHGTFCPVTCCAVRVLRCARAVLCCAPGVVLAAASPHFEMLPCDMLCYAVP